MNEYAKKKLESDFRDFAARNFETPATCRNIEQVRYYVQELCSKIEEYRDRFDYVPQWAYTLLAQYNSIHNSLLHSNFKEAYA